MYVCLHRFKRKRKKKEMKTRRILTIVAVALASFAIIKPAVSSNYDEQVVVTIKGNIKTVEYNGELQSSIGYTTEISSPLYSAENIVSFAIDSVSATNAGTYSMGISSSDFSNCNPKFKNVVFVVYDGQLCINDSNMPQSPLAIEK